MSPAQRLAQRLHCPGCGRRYQGADLRLVGVGRGELDLYLHCGFCGLYAQLTIPDSDSALRTVAAAVARGHDQPDELSARPVTVEDVAEIRQFLSSFEGDMTRLLEKAGDSP